MSTRPLRRSLLIVDDDARLREVLGRVIPAREFDMTLTGTGAEALATLEKGLPEVALVDLGLPDMDGLELVASIRRRYPGVPVVALVMPTGEGRILSGLRAGACGYVIKDHLGAKLVRALFAALDGGVPLASEGAKVDPPAAPGAASGDGGGGGDGLRPSGGAKLDGSAGQLTERERSLIDCFARGHSYDDAAYMLGIPADSVRAQVRSLYEKLDVTTKTEAIMVALRRGLWSPRAR